MILTLAVADEIRSSWSRNELTNISVHFDSITLGAALELACCRHEAYYKQLPIPLLIESWLEQWPIFARACFCLEQCGFAEIERSDLWATPTWELCAAPTPDQIGGSGWGLFQQRFSRSLRNNGFSNTLSTALAGALSEMTDNILEHSQSAHKPSASGVIGFQVNPRLAIFSIADVGQGVLASLQKNPQWRHLDNPADALLEAVWNGASSKTQEQRGEGFMQVHKAVSQLNGCMRFRSGDSALSVRGSLSQRQIHRTFGAPLTGFQLTVLCSPDEVAKKILKFVF